MRCDFCGSDVTVYELYPRSYRLYTYLCKKCKKGFLAHHFDLNLEIYQMDEVGMREFENLIFITGLKAEPRVFDFEVEKDVDSVIVCERKTALGELVNRDEYVFAPYSEKSKKRLCRLMGIPLDSNIADVTKEVAKRWKAAE